MNLTSVRLVRVNGLTLSAGDSRVFWKIALAALADSRKSFAEWEEECEAWRKQGKRPHYCRHGANMWVDHDIACGRCEHYGYWDYSYQESAAFALDSAELKFRDVIKRRKAMFELVVLSAPIPSELWEWVNAPIKEYVS